MIRSLMLNNPPVRYKNFTVTFHDVYKSALFIAARRHFLRDGDFAPIAAKCFDAAPRRSVPGCALSAGREKPFGLPTDDNGDAPTDRRGFALFSTAFNARLDGSLRSPPD